MEVSKDWRKGKKASEKVHSFPEESSANKEIQTELQVTEKLL